MNRKKESMHKQLSTPAAAKATRLSLVLLVFTAIAGLGISGVLHKKVSATVVAGQPQKTGAGETISESAQLQIKALLEEKESRTPAQQKIDSQLIYAAKMQIGQMIAAGVPTLEVDVNADAAGNVVVDITAVIDDVLLGELKAKGAEILSALPQYQSLRARVKLNQLESLASLSQVRFIQPKQEYRLSQRKQRPVSLPSQTAPGFEARATQVRQQLSDAMTNGILPNGTLSVGNVTSEGDTTHRASTARGTFNVNGTGVKIGVISDGVTTLAASQASGDLGTVTVLPGQTGSGDEGTAMLEIVHDLAPGAQLFFATADPTITQFAQNIRDLRTAGCDIIVDDVGYFVESAFQDGQSGATNTNGGVVTQAVNDVVAAGALYFSSAGNSGNKNDNTSTTWEGDFVSGGTLAVVPGGGTVNDFDPSAAVAQTNIITVGGGTGVPMNLSWSDPLGGSSNDYDLFILNNAGTTVSTSSTNVQSGTQDPYEQVNTNNTTGRRVVIRQKTGAANRFLHLSLNGGLITFNTSGEIHGHAAASGCYGVAASPAFSAFNFPPPANFGPYPNAYSAANQVETFSSDGPRKIFFTGNGTAITPGDFSSTGGQTLQQPVVTAADGVAVTGAGGFGSPFFGTSAAAPHAAAIAGLVKSANPSFTQAQIKTALTTTALDIETAGTDRDAGFGIVVPYPALQSLGVTGKAFLELGTVTATESCCNLNGLIERGEAATLNVALNNPGLLNATGLTATLATTTPGVLITGGTSAYADLAATSGTGTNLTPFNFALATTSAVDVVINFTLTVNYAGGWNPSQVINFTVETGRKPITTVLDTTAPASSTSFPLSATGTQTNLVFPDDPPSTCAAPTASPGTLSSTTPRFDSYTLTNTLATSACVTVTITADKAALGAIQAVAYTGSFTPANVSTNYLADPGFTAIVFPGYPGVFSFNVPASGTIVVVVVELKSPTNGFPSAVGSTYTLKVAGLPVTALPTLAKVKSFTADSFDNGQTLLQWQSSYEIDNLGYNVYREEGGQRTKINSQIIGGSALITGQKVALTSGRSYAWSDVPGSKSGAVRYYLEDIDLNGKSSLSGPISLTPHLGKAPTTDQSQMLAQLGMAQGQLLNGQGSLPLERQAEVAPITAAGLQAQAGLAGSNAFKIGVKSEGWYRLPQADLLRVGLDSRTDPRLLQLFVDGQPVPMFVKGEADGRLDAADSVEFYGLGLNSQASNDHVYWLAVGTTNGLRIKSITSLGSAAAPTSFQSTVERKDRTLYFSSLRNGETENFFGPIISSTGVTQTLNLANLATPTTGAATVEVAVQGVTTSAHQVQVMVNGSAVGTITFNGQTHAVQAFGLPQSLLNEGSNSVRLAGLGGASDFALIDDVKITYWHRYAADGNQLRFTATGGQRVALAGFTSSNIRVMDVTNPNSPQEVTATLNASQGSLMLTVPGTAQRTLYAFASEQARTALVKKNQPSNWRQAGLSADYVVITRSDLTASLLPLVNYRRSQGYNVTAVDVEDIYDEFSYGNRSPQAIRDFLAFTKSNWGPAPRFVLMGGKGTYDPKNYLALGDNDIVSAKLIDTAYMETASDDWFVDFSNDGLPQMAIGRLPVRTAAEASRLVAKIIGYDSQKEANSVLLVSDTGEGYDFSASNNSLRGLLPGVATVTEIQRGAADDATTRGQLLAALNGGQKIINYSGHGSVNLWRGNLLTNDDAKGLTNRQSLELFVVMNCLNGYHIDPVLASLGEELLRADGGGASAVWASSGQSEPQEQTTLNQEFYRQLFGGTPLTIGEAAARAKAAVTNPDVRRTWTLLGDPAMRLR